MGKYKHEGAATEFNDAMASKAGAALSPAGNARRSFLGRVGRRTAALAMFGLGGEAWMQTFAKHGIMSRGVAGENSRMLFASNFEGDMQFGAPYGCGSTSCYQDILGTDPTTGFGFEDLRVLGGGKYNGHLITGVSGTNSTNVLDYHVNEIKTTIGPHGNQTRAANFKIIKSTAGANQNIFGYTAGQPSSPERLYFSYWVLLEPDLIQKLGPNGWMSFWGFKCHGGDFRLQAQIGVTWDGAPYWIIRGDDQEYSTRKGIPRTEYFVFRNDDFPIPQGEWAKVECFYDRNGRGRVWWAVNGTVLFDYIPPEGKDLYGHFNNRIAHGTFHSIRAGSSKTRDVWLDEFEVWDDFPPDSSNSPLRPQSPSSIEVTERERFGDTA